MTEISQPSQSLSREPHSLRWWLRRLGPTAVMAIAVGDLIRRYAIKQQILALSTIVPIAPSTAIAFILMGAALGLGFWNPLRRGRSKVAVALCAVAAAMALHVAGSNLAGTTSGWESWFSGLAVVPDVGSGLRTPHMPPQTAVLIIVSIFSLAVLFSPLARRSRLRDAAIVAALLIEGFALLSVTSYAAGNPPLRAGGLIQMGPLAMVEFALFNALLLFGPQSSERLREWLFGQGGRESARSYSAQERTALRILAAVGFVAVAGSVVYLRVETANQQARVIEDLESMGDLKVRQVEQWRRERLTNAEMLRRAPWLPEVAATWASSPDSRQPAVEEWLRAFVENYQYSGVVVYNAALQPIAATPRGALTAPGLEESLGSMRTNPRVIELPLYLDNAGVLHWDLLVPLTAAGSGAVMGAIWLRTDPTRHIIPLLETWPPGYQTGQTVLWFPQGDRLLALGGLRAAPNVSPGERRPFGTMRMMAELPPQSLPARFLRGEINSGEGTDFRGVAIVGIGRPIEDSTWLLTSRLDSNEIYAPLRRHALVVAGLLAGLLTTGGGALSWLARQRQRNLLNERLAAELEQKRLAARLGLVMQHAKDIIFVTDERMQLIDANQQAVDTYGWSREELLQMTIPDLRAAETLSSLPGIIKRANSPEGVIFETVHRRKDGTRFPVEVSVRQVEVDGRPHLLSILRDISERKRAEDKLRDSEEKFSKAFQANPSGIAISELATGRYIEVNESFCRLMRYSSEDLVGHSSVELGIWDSASDRSETFKPLLDGGSLRNVEMQTRTHDGEPKTILVNAELIELNGRRCVVSLVEDITARKQAEAKLRQLSSIIEQAPLSVIIMDLTRRIEYVNPKCLAVTGYTREEVIGRYVGEFGTKEMQPEVFAAMWQAMTDRQVWTGEVRSRRKNGEVYLEHVVTAPLSDHDGRATHYVVLKDDITAQKRSEAELAKERELSGMKSKFLSVASHEFRTPLAAALGSMELLERHAGRLTEAKRGELFGRARNSLGRLTDIMNHVLQVSQADSGRVKVKRMKVDLGRFVQDVVNDVAHGDRNQHVFLFRQSGDPGPVSTDTSLLNHILSNLVGNAARYSPAGTQISVTLAVDPQEFVLVVADEGIGIPVAERERIFEPFVRGSNVGQIGGTGLGLNIARRYTELMGGRIELLPVDRGATFRVNLPCSPDPA